VLKPAAGRLVAVLVPRVGSAWPAIAGVALAVVLAHSGVLHLEPTADLADHYRVAIGTDAWTRAIGIAQLFAAGGLCFRRTRVATASAIVAVLAIAVCNLMRMGRFDELAATAFLIAWAALVAIGEARRNRASGAA
jgi:hypothetical protein